MNAEHKGWINRHNTAASRAADVVVAECKDWPLPCSMGETETVRSIGSAHRGGDSTLDKAAISEPEVQIHLDKEDLRLPPTPFCDWHNGKHAVASSVKQC